MPYVHIDIIKRDLKKKRKLAKAVTDAVAESLGVSPEKVHVIINEITRHQHAVGGVLNIDKEKNKSGKDRRKSGRKT